jgi:phosphatidate cytidylyltransferase
LAHRLGDDIAQRLASGLVMGAIAALFTVSGAMPFALLAVCAAIIVSWEWGRLVRGQEADIVIGVHVVAAGTAAALAAFGYVGLGLLALPIGAILAMVLSLGQHSALSALGVFYAGLPAVFLIWLRSDAAYGLLAVLFLIIVVVAADTTAFFAGRLVGGPKLWTSVSPNKTWSGLVGALIASALAGALFWLAVPGSSAFRLALIGGVLGIVSQAGDLAESALKRYFDAKDAGELIPGHGGLMDRLDGLVAVASVVGMAALVLEPHTPARTLLLGM